MNLSLEETHQYEVMVRQRVPYLTLFLWRLFSFFAITALLAYLVLYPVKDVPGDIAVAYFNQLLPPILQKCIVFSFAGFFITSLLYLYIRLYKRATVTFEQDYIHIKGKSIELKLEIENIKKVSFMDDSREVGGQLKEKFVVYFQQRKEKSVRLKLVHYLEGENFTNEFLRYPHLNYEFLNIEFSPDLENEI